MYTYTRILVKMSSTNTDAILANKYQQKNR